MAIGKVISGKRLLLRPLEAKDATPRYLAWMQDPWVNQYLESRFSEHSIDSLRDFIAAMNRSADNFLFGIFTQSGAEHIGNIKIGNINARHLHADVGLVIGDAAARGHGYASEAIGMVTDFAFSEIGLNKLFAGMYMDNAGSARAFLRAGYREIGILKRHVYCNDRFIDSMLVEKCRED